MYYTLREVSKLLGVRYYQITYAIRSGNVQEPDRARGRYLYSDTTIDKLRKYFDKVELQPARK